MKFSQYKCIYLLGVLLYFIPAIRSHGQPVRTVPAPAPVDNKTSKLVTKPKKVVVKINTDSDGDGLVDKADKCPDVYGPPSNDGCPIEKKKDRDKDGVPDETDECPDVAASSSVDGCPPRASLKIVSDVNAKIYVDGVAKADINSAIAYTLRLEPGFFDIKIVSTRYNVFEVKEGYNVENSSQQDYWKVQLKDDEDAEAKVEKSKKLAQNGQGVANLISNCMVRSFSYSGKDWKYSMGYSDGHLQIIIHLEQVNSKGEKSSSDHYQNVEISAIKQCKLYTHENLNGAYPSGNQLMLYGDVSENYVRSRPPEATKSNKSEYMYLPLKDDCAQEVFQKIKKLLEE